MPRRRFSHPLRVKILEALTEGPASPSVLADRFDLPLGNVSYHTRILHDMRLIQLVKTTPVRGTIEHTYALKVGAAVMLAERYEGLAKTLRAYARKA